MRSARAEQAHPSRAQRSAAINPAKLVRGHNMPKQKLIVIVGPNASGKSALAVTLAKKLNAEVISADSRQVYRGLDIGTGKITKRERSNVPHHLLDIADPKKQISVAEFKTRADRAAAAIYMRGKIPILVGGTGFWVDAVALGKQFPAVPPNEHLRRRLEKKSAVQLLHMLRKLDPRRAQNIEKKNQRRLIRAIEVARALGRVPRLIEKPIYDTLWLGLTFPPAILRKRIRARLERRLRAGMIQEALELRSRDLSWKRFYELGLEYRFLADYLRGNISREELSTKLEKAIFDYARRQLGWFRKNRRIRWIRNTAEAERLARNFLNL